MNIGNTVGRISYNCDIVFTIIDIKDNIVILQGKYIRLIADSPITDLIEIKNEELTQYEEADRKYQKKIIDSYKDKISHITGKILHIDSDNEYLDKCLNLYKSLNLYAQGIIIQEENIYKDIISLIQKYRPNIVVLTGHDSYNKKDKYDLNNYRNSLNFMKAVIKIREYYSLDDICVYAGACGSNFEALIASGANFASSIDRKNIEAYDPAIVAILAAITPFDRIIDIQNVYSFSKMKKGGIGGIETYGKMRLLVK